MREGGAGLGGEQGLVEVTGRTWEWMTGEWHDSINVNWTDHWIE